MSLRDGPFQDLRVPLTWTAAVAVIVAGIVGVALLLNDRRETAQLQVYGATKSVVDTVSTPVGKVVATPGRWIGAAIGGVQDYFFAGSENHRLRQQLADMQRLQDETIQLRNTNARLRAILGLTVDPPLPMTTAQVIADSRGPFANSRLADAGSERGVAIGNPVMSDHGLVGRVVGATRGASRVLLLTDVSSRTPVMVDRTNARAILTGDGGGHPKLAYMRGVDPVKIGDRVLTSGDGGIFPRGLLWWGSRYAASTGVGGSSWIPTTRRSTSSASCNSARSIRRSIRRPWPTRPCRPCPRPTRRRSRPRINRPRRRPRRALWPSRSPRLLRRAARHRHQAFRRQTCCDQTCEL